MKKRLIHIEHYFEHILFVCLLSLVLFMSIVTFVLADGKGRFINAAVPCNDDPETCSLDQTAPSITLLQTTDVSQTEKLITFSAEDFESGISYAQIRVEVQGNNSNFFETDTGLTRIVGGDLEDYTEYEFSTDISSYYNQLGQDGTYEIYAYAVNGNSLQAEKVLLASYSYEFIDPNQLSVSLSNTKIAYTDPNFNLVIDSATDVCTAPITELYVEIGSEISSETYPIYQSRCEFDQDMYFDLTNEVVENGKIAKVRLKDSDNNYWPGPTDSDFFNVSFDLGNPIYAEKIQDFPTSDTQEIRFNIINDSLQYFGQERVVDTFAFEIPGHAPANSINTRDGYYYLDISDLNLDQNQQYEFKIRITDSYAVEYPRTGEFFTFNFDYGNFPQPVLDLNASDNSDSQVDITYTVPNDALNIIRVQRVDGACTDSNYPLNHESGLTVNETIDPVANDSIAFSDLDVTVGQAYCYAAFTFKNDIWNDAITFGSTGNYNTGFVGGDNEPPTLEILVNPGVVNKALTSEVEVLFRISDQFSNIVSGNYTVLYSDLGSPSTNSLTPLDEAFDSTSEEFRIIVGQPASPGSTITISFEATDASGNLMNLDNYLILNVIDNANPPTVTLDTYTPDPTDNVRPTITGQAYDPDNDTIASVEFLINDAGFVNWTQAIPADGAFDEVEENFIIETPIDLPDGNMVYHVRAFDSAGNVLHDGAYARELITIQAEDSTPPLINVFDIPDIIYETSPEVEIEVEDDETDIVNNIQSVDYSLDNNTWITATPTDGAYNSSKELFQIQLENLPLGQNTVYFRATDVANNSTTQNYSLTFTIAEQNPNLEAVKVTLTEDFSDTSNSAIQLTTAIWGNGIARLAVDNTLTRTTLSNTYLAPRYGTYSGASIVERSTNGGFWVNTTPLGQSHQFIFVSDGGVTTMYDIAALHGLNVVNQGNEDLQSITVGGREYLVVLTGVGFVILDTNNTPSNPNDDTVANYIDQNIFSGRSQFNMAEVIDNGDGTFGVLIHNVVPTPSISYVEPLNDFADINDGDIIYQTTAPALNAPGGVRLKQQPGTNNIWFLRDSDDDIIKWNYGASVEDEGDDAITAYGVQRVRDIDWDSQGNMFVATSGNGIAWIESNGTVHNNFITRAQVGDFGLARIYYMEGQYPEGDQLFAVAIGSGFIYHIYYNNTLTNRFDDQIIQYDPFLGNYPADEPHLYIENYNTFFANMPRYGFFKYDIDRDFDNTNVAVSVTSVNEHLYADYIKLESANVVGYNYDVQKQEKTKNKNIFANLIPNAKAQTIPANVQVQVTNNGVDWYDIDVGEIVNFPQEDYRIRFRLILQKAAEGQTPIIDNLQLTYSAYKDASSVETNGVNVTFNPDSICKNSNNAFSISINTVDILGNPTSENGNFSIAMRKVGSATNASGLSVTGGTFVNGSATLNGVTFNTPTEGVYQLYVNYNSEEYLSDSGLLVSNCNNNVEEGGNNTNVNNPKPSIEFTADDYQIAKGEKTNINWKSANVTKVTIAGIGQVNLNGKLEVSPQKTTKYKIIGEGPYGSVEAELTIIVEGTIADLVAEVDTNQTLVGNKVKVSWNAEGADYVRIVDVEGNLSPIGTHDVFFTSPGTFVIEVIAYYPDGTTQSKIFSITVLDSIATTEEAGDVFSYFNTLGTSVTTLTAATLATIIVLNRFGIIGLLLPRRKKYWGIVYDSEENRPISFATLRVFNSSGNMVSQTVSDIDGKYGLLVEEPGNYKLEARAVGFANFEREIVISEENDELEVVEDVPMQKIDESSRNFLVNLSYSRSSIYNAFRKLLFILTIVGFIYSMYAALVSPLTTNIMILVFYFVLFAAHIYVFTKKTVKGRVVDQKTGESVGGASVRIYQDNRQISIALTNNNGELKLKLKPGKYQALASKQGYQMYSKDGESSQYLLVDIEINNYGYITEDILITKLGGKNTRDSNPFS